MMIPYDNQMRDYEFNIEKHRKHHKQKNGKSATEYFNNSILTFDIEVSSGWLKDGKVIGYETGYDNDYWNQLYPLALPYIWQFSCDGIVYYGRELWEFEKVLQDIPKELKTIIWVHNLSYEFVFLSNFLHWKSVFARSPHKPMKCVSVEYPNIEFRCSYYLTRLSLNSWGQQLKVHKATGDLDYEILRTPLSKLSEKELNYCEQDCRVVEAGIKEYIKRYGKQRDIPLTQTGTVRREVKERLTSDPVYVRNIKKLIPKDAVEYAMLQEIFAGGYTHANKAYSGVSIQDHIEHYDFASSYPSVMIAEKYPMQKWIYTGLKHIPPIESFDDTAYIFRVRFSQLNCVTYNTYIQGSKCTGKKIKYDNGRVLRAESLEMYMTEQDYLTISETYQWEDIEVSEVYKSRKAYLPKEFTEYILELYRNKTTLKDVEGQEDLYMQSKQYINSMYGMCVTAIIQSDVVLDGDEWRVEELTADYVNEKLDKLRDFNPRERRYFLSYSWGCWVTAYARRNLWKCIESVDEDLLYCDTDSIFVIGHKDFKWYNDEITEKLRKACDVMDLDFEMTRPKTIKGKEKPLGVFAKEDDCSEFITLGAKRYVERRVSDGKLHLTVSGINKEAVELLEDDIDNFEDGFEFDKDASCVHKRLSTYVTDMPVVKWNDGYISRYTHGINMRRTGYKLTMTDEYKDLIKYTEFNKNDIPESFYTYLRGRFTFKENDG